MTEYQGKSAFSGVAIGKIYVFSKGESIIRRTRIEDKEAEKKRFDDAKDLAKEQLDGLYEKAMKEVGETSAAIFEAHRMFLEDPGYLDSVYSMIANEGINAEFAVATTGDNYAEMLAAMDDDYMRARAADVKDVSNRVISILQGVSANGLDSDEPVILLADDLAPSETVQFDKSKILSFVTRHGSMNSHTSILARMMGIPSLITVDYDASTVNGKMGIVDGYKGILIVEPDDDTIAKYQAQKEEDDQKKQLLQSLKGQKNVTLDGHEINVYANIAGPKDIGSVLDNDAGGIGLFRSEFLYLESDTYPTEDEQYEAYKKVVQMMAGKDVIIRTLDIGADKQCDYFNLDKEENPALGFRAIRICLKRPEIFKTQLRAIYRASYFGSVGIMFPMITSVDEVRQIKKIVEEVKAELDSEGIEYGDVDLGIMVETPAAVFESFELAKEVDFFSIGTNDLTQYTLACDRQNPNLTDFADPHSPAVLKAIQMTIENGHKGGAWVGICGELGADTELTETFLRMGVDELSVSPSRVLAVRDAVRKVDLSK